MRYGLSLWLALALIGGCSDSEGTGGSGGSAGTGGGGGDGMAECRVHADCDDNNACTEDDCFDAGLPEEPPMCENSPIECDDDHSECTTDACNPATGCEYTPLADGTPCAGGTCQAGLCELAGTMLPCSEQAIKNAVAAGGGPYTFDCDGPTTIPTSGIEVYNDVILDGEGNLTLHLAGVAPVFVTEDTTAELRSLTVTGSSSCAKQSCMAVLNRGTLTLTDVTITQGQAGIYSPDASLTVVNSTVSEQEDQGIIGSGEITLTNSTVSGNREGIFLDAGTMRVMNCTVVGTINNNEGDLTLEGTLVDGSCTGVIGSSGHNIESPGNTCGFDTNLGDQVSVTAEQLNLGPLADNGGPTMTHALLPGSVAIDQIPEGDCAVDADQRHVSRPRGDRCDVGAVEVDLACIGADDLSECTHRNFTGVCGADICWATDCSELSDGINCLLLMNRVPFAGRCAAGSCEEDTAFSAFP